MEEKKTDVDLETLLEEAFKSEETDTSGASDQKQETDGTVKSKAEDGTEKEEKKEEISPRADERIRELAEEVKRLKEAQGSEKKVDGEHQFEDVDSFIAAIQDEPSRKLLKTFADLLDKRESKKFSPVLNDYQQTKFDKDFDTYASKFPSLNAHREDIKKSFERDPNQSVKALISEVVMDVMASKIKPIEKKPSQASRGGAPNLDTASKDDLYAALEAHRPN